MPQEGCLHFSDSREKILQDPWLDGAPSYAVPLSAVYNLHLPTDAASSSDAVSDTTATASRATPSQSGSRGGSSSGSGNNSGSNGSGSSDDVDTGATADNGSSRMVPSGGSVASEGKRARQAYVDTKQANGDGGEPVRCLTIAKRVFRLPKGRLSQTAAKDCTTITDAKVCIPHILSECPDGRLCTKYHVCRSWARRLGLDGLLLARSKTYPRRTPVRDSSNHMGQIGQVCTAFTAGTCEDPSCHRYHVDHAVLESARRKFACPPEAAVTVNSVLTAVPLSVLSWTKGLAKLEQQLQIEPSSWGHALCEEDRTMQHCPHGEACRALHLDRAALRDSPFDYLGGTVLPTPCCWRHGDKSSHRSRTVRGIVVGTRKYHFAIGMMARTAAAVVHDQWAEVKHICVDHLKSRCRRGAGCPLYHICRLWVWRVKLYEPLVKGGPLPDSPAQGDDASDCPTLLSGTDEEDDPDL
eukprot:TRINITY_DN22935_c0_g1_i1.p1 TRINITY_DN22935_c0_g1~~TRINITY_DN22935_c0_g1_i1.p1  ORF type:complete len:468 (+),score=101.02 TRINITY_DN22935_c0_g1_i1:69-1472(+)